MKHITKVLPVLGLVASMSYAGNAAAEFTGNAAATSNYVWRGVTQTDDGSAIQGGLDYGTPFGVYVGAWTSNSAFDSYELDLYAGYGFEVGPVGIDVGGISYLYPSDGALDQNYSEGYVGFSFDIAKTSWLLQGNYSSNVASYGESGLYVEAGVDFDIAKDLTVGLHVGSYDYDEDLEDLGLLSDYTDYSVSLTKGDFTFTYSATDLEDDATTGFDAGTDDEPKVFITWSKEWDLLK